MDNKRDTFKNRFGFILACIGSAVGMGNIWMFPYRVGACGGAAFLIPYFIFVFVLGFAGVAGEMAFGRAMGAGSIGSFRKAAQMRGQKWGGFVGFVPTVASLGIAIGYSVVVGWILKFLAGSFLGELMKVQSEEYFGAIASDFGSIPWHMAALAITFVIMVFGISKGIEKVNKFLMPLFFGLFLILAIRVFFLEGSEAGYQFLLKPDWSMLAEPKTWIYALGQAFFSLSLAGCGTIVYGSYLKKDENIIACARNVAIFDTLAALLAAFVILPAVFAFGMDPSAGPPLMFITMPKVFQQMPAGNLFCIIFFVAVFFAAITSLINLFETPVEAVQEKFKVSRGAAVLIVACIAIPIGILIESGDTVSSWMDLFSIYLTPVGALLAAIMFFWVCPKGFAREQVQMGREKTIGKWFEPMTKYVFVGLTIAVCVLGILFGGIG